MKKILLLVSPDPSMKSNRINILLVLLAFGLMPLSSVSAATVEWQFVKQACSSLACNSADPSIASLYVEDIVGGVEFTLAPNWNYEGSGGPNSISGLDVAFNNPAGPAPTIGVSNFTAGSDNPYRTVTVGSPMTNAYVSSGSQFSLTWNGPNKFLDGIGSVSNWTIIGDGITTDLFSMALASDPSGKPKPIFAIISTQGLSGFPSDWVTGSSPVPVPAAIWLFGTGLIGLIGFTKRRKQPSL